MVLGNSPWTSSPPETYDQGPVVKPPILSGGPCCKAVNRFGICTTKWAFPCDAEVPLALACCGIKCCEMAAGGDLVCGPSPCANATISELASGKKPFKHAKMTKLVAAPNSNSMGRA